MEPQFDPNTDRPRSETLEAIRVHDTISINDSTSPTGLAGTVLILDSYRPGDADRLVGEAVQILVEHNPPIAAIVRAVRDHGTTISLFIEGLGKADVPIDSLVEFPQLQAVLYSPPIGSRR